MKKIIHITLVLLLAAAVVVLCIYMIPFVQSLWDEETRTEFAAFIERAGIGGAAVMLLIQTLQVIVAVIPGEPIELLMGLMYGAVPGLLLTLCGIVIGETAVFFAVRKWGVGFASKFVDTAKFSQLSFLKNPTKRDVLLFLLFFIPGTPKDILCYFAPFSGISAMRFLLLSVPARIPSVVTSTVVGDSVGDGNLTVSVLLFAATGVIGLAGIAVNHVLQKKWNKQS